MGVADGGTWLMGQRAKMKKGTWQFNPVTGDAEEVTQGEDPLSGYYLPYANFMVRIGLVFAPGRGKGRSKANKAK
jgi:hypothetical protein